MKMFTRLLLDRRRGATWWAMGTAGGVASFVGLWPSVRGNGDIENIVKSLPTGLQAMFGMEHGISISSAPGYLQARLFATTLPIILIIYAIGLGASVIGGAEEDGTLQLVVVAPVTRRRIAFERFAAAKILVLWLVVIGLVTTLAIGAAVGIFDNVSIARVLVEMVAVTELTLLHLSIAFAAGAATGRRGPALTAGSAVAVGGYVVHALAAAAPVIEPLRVISPWWWFLDRNLLVHGPTFLSVGLPVLLAGVIFVAGVVAFERRDLKLP